MGILLDCLCFINKETFCLLREIREDQAGSRIDYLTMVVEEIIVRENKFQQIPCDLPTLYHCVAFPVQGVGTIEFGIDYICKLHQVTERQKVKYTIEACDVWYVIMMGS